MWYAEKPDWRRRHVRLKIPKLDVQRITAEQRRIDVLESDVQFTSKVSKAKSSTIEHLEEENRKLRALPPLLPDGSLRPIFMLTAHAAHLECGIPVEKLSIAAQFFHVAWHEVECDEDTPAVSSYHFWFDDFAFKEKHDVAEYSATPGLRTWVLDVRVLSYVQMWHQMWVLKPNQDS